jgi:hypothetical protein
MNVLLALSGHWLSPFQSALTGESAWKGNYREQLRWALDDAPVGRYGVVLVLAQLTAYRTEQRRSAF